MEKSGFGAYGEPAQAAQIGIFGAVHIAILVEIFAHLVRLFSFALGCQILIEVRIVAHRFGGQADITSLLAGLAGLGDLVLTCTGDLSRNRQVGIKLAEGLAPGEIVASTPMVAEGVKTASIALDLASRHGVEMPITAQMHAVLNLGLNPATAIQILMTRSLKNETD